MGGFGSGRRWSGSAKDTVDGCPSLDVNWMTREGLFDGHGWRSGVIRWSHAGTGKETCSVGYEAHVPGRWLRLQYRRIRDDQHFDYKVPLTTTPLPWGGVRWWFVCPLTCNGRSCGRRVGMLYLPSGARYFGCRHCYDLTYESCQESHKYDSLWISMAAQTGETPRQVEREMREDADWGRQAKRRAKRNEQRRRRRKARNWA